MSTQCDDMIPLILRSAEGTLDASGQAQLAAHTAACAACAEAVHDQREMRQALVSLAETSPVTHAATRVLATLRAEADAAAGSTWADMLDWRRWTWRLVPVAAALAVAVAAVAQQSTDTADSTTGVSMTASNALFTDEVSGADLLTLMLNADADSTVTTSATTGGAR